jgi:hypothetical protein
MKNLLTLTIFAAFITIGSAAHADGPFPANMTNGTYGPVGSVTPNSSTGEFEIYDAVNLLLNTSYTNNAQIDPLEYTGSTSTWAQTSDGGYAFIGLGAGAVNSLEVYNPATPNTLISPFGGGFTGDGNFGNGTPGNPFYGTGNVVPVGTKFGFALNQVYGGSTNWYGDPTLNSDGMDHMLVYNLSSLAGTQITIYDPTTNTDQLVTLQDPYLLAFEDLPIQDSTTGSPSDIDYNDYIVLVDGVAPVPEPMTLALFTVGLLAMVGFGLRRKFAFVK